MKYLLRFNEGLSPEQIDDLLDKMNRGEELTDYEKLCLQNSHNKDFNVSNKDYLILEIKKIVEQHDGCITTGQLQLDTSPVYKSEDQSISLIECFFSEHVQVVEYGGYKYDTPMSEYTVPYEELSLDILKEIKIALDENISDW